MKNKIRVNMDMKSFVLAFSILILTVLLISFIPSQLFTGAPQIFTRANVAVSPSPRSIGFPMFDRSLCEAGQDFILQVDPLGCVPSVVRSDLLENQNVPVFCPIVATKLNPLINVETIRSMIFSFSGVRPPEISGIGYYPARAAVGRTGQVTQPILNNLGYAVIVLKQQGNESAMADFVEGNLTATIRYDIKNAFGVGRSGFLLSEITNEDEWNRDFKRYSFWDGRGYLRAESIGDDEVSISVYSDRETYGLAKTDKRKIATKILKKGETSEEIFMPGFDYCRGSLQLELKKLETPGTMARLNINGDVLDLKEKGKFIDNKCEIKSLDKQGVVERVTINCDDDDRIGTFPLSIIPKVNLKIGDDIPKEYSVGDILYPNVLEGEKVKRNVFLGYIGKKGDVEYIIPVISAASSKEKFLESFDKKALEIYVEKISEVETGVKIVDIVIDIVGKGVGAIVRVFNALVRGTDYGTHINIGEEKEVTFLSEQMTGPLKTAFKFWAKNPDWVAPTYETKTIKFIGLAGPKDTELSIEVKNYYEKAMEDYEEIRKSFSQEKYPDTEQRTLGEQALLKEIELAETTNQKKTALELCQEFEEDYPDSEAPDICAGTYKLSSHEGAVKDVVINNRVYRIAFDGIREPRKEEYSVDIIVSGADEGFNGKQNLRKDKRIYVSQSEFIMLKELEKDYAIFDVKNIDYGGIKDITKRPLIMKINLNDFEPVGTKMYHIRVDKIYLKKLAEVSVKPNIRHTETKATFPFRIGIEKRAIQLSPEKTEERIESLNNTIEKWRSISDKLETAVKVGKAACFGVGTGLTVTNFFANLKGEGIARQKVMRGPNGWFNICEEEVLKGNYGNVDSCLLAKNPEIEASVDERLRFMEAQNEEFKRLQEGITKEKFLGEDVVDTGKLMALYVDDDYRSELSSNVQDMGNTIKVGNQDVEVSKIIELIEPGTISITQARNLELNARLLNSQNDGVRAQALADVKADLGDIWVNSREEIERQTLETQYGGPVIVGSTTELKKYAITEVKTFGEVKIKNNYHGASIEDGGFVQKFYDKSDGREYLLLLNNNYVITQTYRIDNGGNLVPAKEEDINPLKLSLEKFDKTTYQNPYKNAEVRYYASGPYKGFPAIVPFDLENGWYVATKPAVSILGGIQPYQNSGRVSSFYLGNVGPDGREEFFSETGDDIYQGFVVGASQPPNFHGLSASEVLSKRRAAENALREAERQHVPGVKSIKISGQRIDVGASTIGIPDIQCQDFMSPSNCNLLFNVCDPVVCPSSRCDLGGTYPVSDVVQSGIIGSLALCLPNFPEVKIPVCLSGIYAGLESYLTVLDSYQSCLETNLETGQTIGICDEIHSVYMCDFFWRQSLPLVKYAIPKIIGSFLGNNVRGGGEYLGFKNAWQRAGDSVGFFTQYYAANSFKAFKTRSAEDVGAEVCKNWVSLVGPGDGKLFDALIEPDVPPQFYGRFDEIPFTTATIPPMSHYKVFYHVYAGKDFPAYYQIYLRGTGEAFYRDVPTRRLIASGFIKAGEYYTETKDFTAPAVYNELCIVVNNKEECGFKQVTTEFGINYITEQYVASQASQTDITTAAACRSGTPNILSLLSPNLQAGVEEGINPAIYNRGITRICATDSPGKATDPFFGTNKSKWRPVGYCDTPRLKCWLDTDSVKDTIKMTTIEDEILEEVTPDYLDVLVKEEGYVENFEAFVDEIEAEGVPVKRIELINEKYNKVYYMSEKGYLTFLRGNEYALLTSMGKVAESEEKKKEEPPEEPPEEPLECEDCGKGWSKLCSEEECFDIEEEIGKECIFEKRFAGLDNSCTEEEHKEETCSIKEDCQEILSRKIIEIAREVNIGRAWARDENVKEDTGAKNFECLVLQMAMTESLMTHCGDIPKKGDTYENFNPLYCEGDISETVLGDDLASIGIMQINTAFTRSDTGKKVGYCGDYELSSNLEECKIQLSDVDTNIYVGIKALISKWNRDDKVYNCYPQEDGDFVPVFYKGWKRALRAYNGWNTQCTYLDEEGVRRNVGNPSYVDDVLSWRDYVAELYPEECGS